MKLKRAYLMLIAITLVFLGVSSFGVQAQSEESDSEQTEKLEEPFSILLLGIDTGDFGRTERGRSDSMMVATVNPDTEHIVVASIPRDSYVEIPGYGMDKINHAYAFGGPELAVETVENWLEMEISFYLTVDMGGLEEVVDAVGGVEVIPPSTFEISGYTFYEGQPTLVDGDQAVAYARERYTSGGDYARQERQRQIVVGTVEAALKKATGLTEVLSIARTFDKVFDSNLSILKLVDLAMKNLDIQPTYDFVQFQGSGTMIDGIYYDEIWADSYNEIRDLLQNNLDSIAALAY